MSPSDIANANVDDIVEKLSTSEAILLMAGGVGFGDTRAVPRLKVPAIKVSDGPNGVRGSHFFMSTPAYCLPCGTALGATWDMELIKEMGRKLLSEEAKRKAASVILAPTCNIPRNPLGGRSFESFSEDPTLSGLISSAYINGVQAGGIGTTIKHFVCNEMENDRTGYNSVVGQRALREIYLLPFMLAQKYANPWSYMTAYNRVNGIHACENHHLLQDILRKEWSFDGLVMTDWGGNYSIDLSVNAGVDLEMPGLDKLRTVDNITRCIESRKLTVRTIKERARKVIELVKRAAQGAPEILDGDGEERTGSSPEDKKLMRRLAAESIVLLKNENGLLPLQPDRLRKVAVIGGNAKAKVLSGGGSAMLKPSYFVSPYDGVVNAFKPRNESVLYREGAIAYKDLPTLESELEVPKMGDGIRGSWYKHASDDSMDLVTPPIEVRLIDETRMFIGTSTPAGITRRWTLWLEGWLKPRDHDCTFEFGLSVTGRAKLYVDGELLIDNWTRQRRRDQSFLGTDTIEEKGRKALKARASCHVKVEFCNVRGPADGDEDEVVMNDTAAVWLGGAEVQHPDRMIEEAVQIAREADVVIAVVGLNSQWESEGYDRKTLGLPGRTDELISKVVAANPKTVVVTQSGSPIALPWADSVPAIVHAWYLGNATGDAIADVLFGKKNPSGKLSLTFPKRLEDIPARGHFHSENGTVLYGEDLFVGYKHYHHRKISPMFAFGHGLSYTTFSYSELELTDPITGDGDFNLTASVTLTNTGNVSGSEIVQLYVSMPSTSHLTHPMLMLRAFVKVKDLTPGKSQRITLNLDKYAISHWDQILARWVAEAGEYSVFVGPSCEHFPLTGKFTVVKGFEWSGL